jgi:hypothetical protein
MYDVERSTDEVVGDSADGILHLDDRVGVASENGNADMRGAVDQPLQSGVHIIERVRSLDRSHQVNALRING